MTLLDRYLLKEFLRILLLVLATFAAIYLLVDFFERIDNFLEVKLPLSLAIRYFLLKIPLVVEQLMPVSILLSGVITMGLLNHRLELTALKAGGISLNRIVVPIMLGGTLASVTLVAMSQWLLPVTISATNTIWYEKVNKDIPKGTIRKGRFFYRGKQGFYIFDQPYSIDQPYSNFSYIVPDDRFGLQLMLTARTARWQQGGWLFFNGQVQRKAAGHELAVEPFARLSFNLPEKPADFFIPEYKYEEMSLSALVDKSRTAAGQGTVNAWLEFHSKLSYMVLGLPLLCLGLPMLILIHQRWGRDLSLAVPASCGLAFIAWIWWGTFQSLAKAAAMSPAFASWSVHFLVGGVGLVLLNQLNK